MNKAKQFQSAVSPLQSAPTENLALLLENIAMNNPITFISWKMFKIRLQSKWVVLDPRFDTREADQFITKEKEFIKILQRLDINFSYLKLIPDELPKLFFNANPEPESSIFTANIQTYFKNIYPEVKIIKFTDLLVNPLLRQTYNLVFGQSQQSAIDPQQLEKEGIFRQTYYTGRPLPRIQSQDLALKAFGLFAAETAIIFQYFKNPVLLAGQRSTNTYKYEFMKYPSNRPVLPKLFVI